MIPPTRRSAPSGQRDAADDGARPHDENQRRGYSQPVALALISTRRRYDERRAARWWAAQYPPACWPVPAHRACACVVCMAVEEPTADDVFLAERLHRLAAA